MAVVRLDLLLYTERSLNMQRNRLIVAISVLPSGGNGGNRKLKTDWFTNTAEERDDTCIKLAEERSKSSAKISRVSRQKCHVHICESGLLRISTTTLKICFGYWPIRRVNFSFDFFFFSFPTWYRVWRSRGEDISN